MSVAEKAEALLSAVTAAELQAMAPAARRRFADVCRRAADLAEPKAAAPTSGALASLRDGRQS